MPSGERNQAAALATLLQSVGFSTVEGAPCEPIRRITLRPKGGMVLEVMPASKKRYLLLLPPETLGPYSYLREA